LKLNELDLLQFIPVFMREDTTSKGLAYAIQRQLNNVISAIANTQIYANIDIIDEGILDELAWQFNCGWYDSNASVDIKRQLIKAALVAHKTRGTAYAVEEVVKSYFDDATVVEWFEYGGDPYTFKVIVKNGVDTDLVDRFTMAVNSVKNIRSVMDELIVGLTCADDLFCDTDLLII